MGRGAESRHPQHVSRHVQRVMLSIGTNRVPTVTSEALPYFTSTLVGSISGDIRPCCAAGSTSLVDHFSKGCTQPASLLPVALFRKCPAVHRCLLACPRPSLVHRRDTGQSEEALDQPNQRRQDRARRSLQPQPAVELASFQSEEPCTRQTLPERAQRPTRPSRRHGDRRPAREL